MKMLVDVYVLYLLSPCCNIAPCRLCVCVCVCVCVGALSQDLEADQGECYRYLSAA